MADTDVAAVARDAYEAFASGDMDRLAEIFADVVWHLPGKSRIAGDKKGWADIAPFFGTLMEATGGTFKGELLNAFAEGDEVITLHRTSATRPDGAALDSLGVLIWRFENGRAVEIHEMFYDQYAEDAFWG